MNGINGAGGVSAGAGMSELLESFSCRARRAQVVIALMQVLTSTNLPYLVPPSLSTYLLSTTLTAFCSPTTLVSVLLRAFVFCGFWFIPAAF